MPSLYRPEQLPQTRHNLWQVRHPRHGVCLGGGIANYDPVPLSVRNYTVGQVAQLVTRTHKDGPRTKTKIIANLLGRRFQLNTDHRFVLRAEVDAGRIYLVELCQEGKPQAVALVRLLSGDSKKIVKAKSMGQVLEAAEGQVEVIDVATISKVQQLTASSGKRVRVDLLFPNASIREMWGKGQAKLPGGAALNHCGQTLTVGSRQSSPYYPEEGRDLVLFSEQLARGIVSAAAVRPNGSRPHLDHLGTVVIEPEAVHCGAVTVPRSGADAIIAFEDLSEAAATRVVIDETRRIKLFGFRLSFHTPPRAELLERGELTCRYWRGGIRVDWSVDGQVKESFSLKITPSGQLLDGQSKPVYLGGKLLNVRRKNQCDKTLNFWQLVAAEGFQGLKGKPKGFFSRLLLALKELAAGKVLSQTFTQEYYQLPLAKGGFVVFSLDGESVLLTCPYLIDNYKQGGTVIATFEQTSRGPVLALYDQGDNKGLARLCFDPEERAFYYPKRLANGDLTYLCLLRKNRPFSLKGKLVYPNNAVFKTGNGFARVFADVRGSEIVGIKSFDRGSRVPLRPILDDQAQVCGYIYGAYSSRSFAGSDIAGWIEVTDWSFKGDAATFLWIQQKRLNAQDVRDLSLEPGQSFWVKVEGKHVLAVARLGETGFEAVAHYKVARDYRGEIVRTATTNIGYSRPKGQPLILEGVWTQQSYLREILNFKGNPVVVRQLKPGESIRPRQVCVLLSPENELVIMQEGPRFLGLKRDLAGALGETILLRSEDRAKAWQHLIEADELLERGVTAVEVGEFIRAKGHPWLSSRFFQYFRATKRWQRAQRSQARKIERASRKLAKDMDVLKKARSSSEVFARRIEELLRQARLNMEVKAESLEVAKARSLAQMYWIGVVRQIVVEHFPVLAKQEMGPETRFALQRFVERPSAFGVNLPMHTRVLVERLDQVTLALELDNNQS